MRKVYASNWICLQGAISDEDHWASSSYEHRDEIVRQGLIDSLKLFHRHFEQGGPEKLADYLLSNHLTLTTVHSDGLPGTAEASRQLCNLLVDQAHEQWTLHAKEKT